MKKTNYTPPPSPHAELALNDAIRLAGRLGHTYVGTEHFLHALCANPDCTTAQLLHNAGVRESQLLEELIRKVGTGTPTNPNISAATPALRRLARRAKVLGGQAGCAQTGTRFMLLAMLEERENEGTRMLSRLGTDLPALERACRYGQGSPCPAPPPTVQEYPYLFRYGSLLTGHAKDTPLIGRTREIDQVIEVLARRQKNNPCLIGEPGVGKTAIVEGVAARFAGGDVPACLQGMYIFSLHLTSLLAGTKYRGEFEERIHECISEVTRGGRIILFLDEVHTLVGAGAAEGAIDASNLLKPFLTKGDLRLIGATTPQEYARTIERDGALDRRFCCVKIPEPDAGETLHILRGVSDCYAGYHHVKLSEDVHRACIQLSEQYIGDRHFPDKAIDLLDEACAHAAMRSRTGKSPAVKVADVEAVAARRTGIPLERISRHEREHLLSLQNAVRSQIIGHDEAVDALCHAVCRHASGFRDIRRPAGSFLLLGPTGVGKTALVTALCQALYGSRERLVRVDMSEYQEAHAASRLLGAPPGYRGCGEETAFCAHLRRFPCSVVLFDEIEKAHPDILHLLLQILEDGCLTDAAGRHINLRHTLLFMTSNLGMHDNRGVGFVQKAPTREQALAPLRKVLPPELIGRMDEVLLFDPLCSDSLRRIAAMQLDGIAERAAAQGVHLEFDEAAVAAAAACPGGERYGARPIRSFLTRQVEDPLSGMWLRGELHDGDSLLVTAGADALQIRTVVCQG